MSARDLIEQVLSGASPAQVLEAKTIGLARLSTEPKGDLPKHPISDTEIWAAINKGGYTSPGGHHTFDDVKNGVENLAPHVNPNKRADAISRAYGSYVQFAGGNRRTIAQAVRRALFDLGVTDSTYQP